MNIFYILFLMVKNYINLKMKPFAGTSHSNYADKSKRTIIYAIGSWKLIYKLINIIILNLKIIENNKMIVWLNNYMIN